MEGWRATMYFEETRLPWVMPSPNMPTLDTAVVYPGTVLFEGTNVSEGRGTTRPFELIGAPWVDAEALCEALASLRSARRVLQACRLRADVSEARRQPCGGCQIHVLDRTGFRPVECAIAVLAEIRAQGPSAVPVAAAALRIRAREDPIDILAGSRHLRQQIESGLPVRKIYYSWLQENERIPRGTRSGFRYEPNLDLSI